MGDSALKLNITGNRNVAIGEDALYTNTEGDHNIAIGKESGITITTGSGNTFLGAYSDASTGTLSNSTAIGYGATVTLSNTIQLGNSDVNLVNTSATVSAIAFRGDGSGLTGIFSGVSSSTFKDAYSNVVVGSKLVSLTPSITINDGNDSFYGYYNLAIGDSTLVNNSTGWNNIALGHSALYNNAIGYRNTAIGANALEGNVLGWDNVAIGANALSENQVGYQNIAIGKNALKKNNTVDNIAIGAEAQSKNEDGSRNIAMGKNALQNNTDGDENIAIGINALQKNVNGYFNVAVGTEALQNNEGNHNTAIGYRANSSNGSLSNSTAIGYGATVIASNTIRLGNTNIVTISGNVAFSPASDRRLKENIKGTKYGLYEVLKLEPVDYVLKSNGLKQLGFIAQDVKPLIPEVVTGIEGDLEKGETLGIAYSSLIPVLTKAIQEQQTIISRLEKMLLSSLERQEVIEKELIEIRSSIKQ